MSIRCWQCGETLTDIIMPLSRREVCPHCESDIHVCRMCRHYSTTAPEQCREHARTEPPSDKTRANFCDFIELSPTAFQDSEAEQEQARARLEALFEGEPAEEPPKPNPLDDLFK